MVPENIQLLIIAPTQIMTMIDPKEAVTFSVIPATISSQLKPRLHATTAATAAAASRQTCVGSLR